MASSNRPPLMTSMVDAILAVTAGFRNPAQMTMWPSRTRSVAIDRADRTVNDSNVISSVGAGPCGSDRTPRAPRTRAPRPAWRARSSGPRRRLPSSRRTRPSSPVAPSTRPACVTPERAIAIDIDGGPPMVTLRPASCRGRHAARSKSVPESWHSPRWLTPPRDAVSGDRGRTSLGCSEWHIAVWSRVRTWVFGACCT